MNIKDLKVGDKVFIREDLEDDKLYGNNVYIDDMCKGIQEIGFVSRENRIIRTVETPDYSYTPEMIDWEKTIKLRREKMNIKDLKVGDVVYIRDELNISGRIGSLRTNDQMLTGVQQISKVDHYDEYFEIAGELGKPWITRNSYTVSMIDWEKTMNLKDMQAKEYLNKKFGSDKVHNPSHYGGDSTFEKITQLVENGKEKTVALLSNGEKIYVTNNDKENDIEKTVMMLMLKSVGITYGDVKKEVEKVKVKWVPKDYEDYYTVDGNCKIECTYYLDSYYDRDRIAVNNYFKTREEAIEKAEKIKEVLRGE